MIDPARIAAAARAIDPVFRNSPQVQFPPLSEALGAELTLKVETLNPIRSFKGRGASWFVQQLSSRQPIVSASAGNFGQGLAYAGAGRGIPVTIFAAENANPLKLERMRRLGAEVILAGPDFDAAKEEARRHAARHGLAFVEDGREPAIAEGAGTMAAELLSAGSFDVILVPVGNGALILGIASWVKARAPDTRVVGVCAAGAPAMERSWRSGRIESTAAAATIADGIAVRVPVPEAVAAMAGVVDEMLLVSDEQILDAMHVLASHTGLLAEPAGARYRGARLATPLCGSNVTPDQFEAWFCGDRPKPASASPLSQA